MIEGRPPYPDEEAAETPGPGGMTKSELIARLAERHPQLVAKDAEYAVKMILDAMTASLVRNERIEIRGFGSFGLNPRPPRMGRNPKSGEKVWVPGKLVPHFKAGKELRERVDDKAVSGSDAAGAGGPDGHGSGAHASDAHPTDPRSGDSRQAQPDSRSGAA